LKVTPEPAENLSGGAKNLAKWWNIFIVSEPIYFFQPFDFQVYGSLSLAPLELSHVINRSDWSVDTEGVASRDW
jgi:hypothetical protein